MFYRHYRLYSNLLLAADVLAGFVALFAAYSARYYLVKFAPLEVSRFFNPVLLPLSEYFFYYVLFIPAWVGLLMLTQRYAGVMRLPVRRQLGRAVQFLILVGFLMGFLTFALKLEVSRPVLFAFLALTAPVLLLNRVVLHWVLRSRNINEHNQIKILIGGTDERARRVGRLLESYAIWGYRVVGYLTAREGEESGDLKVLGSVRQLPELLEAGLVADEIIFLPSGQGSEEGFRNVIEVCEDWGIRTRIAADYFPTSISKVSLEYLDELPLITFSTIPEHSVAIVVKRVLDFTVAATSLLVLSPLMLAAAALVKFTSPGPVFYSQQRCGLFGRRFRLVKFRTMEKEAEDKLWDIMHLNEMEGPVFKMRNDPRVTPLGRYLRKFSVDELPQLWNVIKGEMSIVGPRAMLPEEVRHYYIKQRRRLSVKPGITCLWQVSGRSDIDFHKWMELDLEYIDNWSLWLDLEIMLRTIPAVFTGRGAR